MLQNNNDEFKTYNVTFENRVGSLYGVKLISVSKRSAMESALREIDEINKGNKETYIPIDISVCQEELSLKV